MSSKTSARTAAAAEALGIPVPYTFGEELFELTPTSKWAIETLEHFEEGRIIAFLRAVLGPEDYKRAKALAVDVEGLGSFVEGMQKALGLAGN